MAVDSVIATFQTLPSFNRVYTAYEGIFITLSGVSGKKVPDLYDWIGAVMCLAGVSVMLWVPHR